MMKLKNIEKLKEKKEAFDILWSNPRYKAIIKLSIWGVLILILSLFVRLGGNDSVVLDDSHEVTFKTLKEQLASIDSYEAMFYRGDDVFNIKVLDDKQLIIHNGETFYFDGANGDAFYDDVILFNVKNISSLVADLDEEYTTKYKDGSYVTNYKVPLVLFVPDGEGIFVDVMISGNDSINKITIDCGCVEFSRVVIELSNINNIDVIDVGE